MRDLVDGRKIFFVPELLMLLPFDKIYSEYIQVNRRGIHHCTSLLWAAGKGSLSLVQLLLRLLS